MISGAKRKLAHKLVHEPDLRARWAWAGNVFHMLSVVLENFSRRMVRFMNSHVSDADSDWYVLKQRSLHKEIERILKQQAREYGHYSYFYGYLYQSLGVLNIYGERGTEERFEAYELSEFIGPDDLVLDIGCNAGFMSVYTSFRTGCSAVGIDINPYMIAVGQAVAKHLRLAHKVDLRALRIQDFERNRKFTAVFSFATHWTDDENYRVPLRTHFEMLAELLVPGGLLFFETHSNDVGDEAFYKGIEEVRDLFSVEMVKDVDKSQRHFYRMRRTS